MPVSIYEDKIRVSDKREALKYLILLKCHEKKITLSDADMDVLIELNETGYGREFYNNCVEKGYFASKQTVVNAVGRMKNLGVILGDRKGERTINKDYLPDMNESRILVKYMVGNI